MLKQLEASHHKKVVAYNKEGVIKDLLATGLCNDE